jgi:multidrug resistance efflux pump
MTSEPTSVSSAPAPTGGLAKPAASQLRSTSILKGARKGKRISRPLLFVIIAAVLAGGAATVYAVNRSMHPARTDLVLHTVRRERLELNIVERGSLESAKNEDVVCRVKAGAKNSTVSSTIKSVIDDGTNVKKDDLLVELDDSGLTEQLKAEKIVLDNAEAAKVKAEENYNITMSQNESDIKTAEVNLELARIDLEKYQKGDYPQAIKDVDGRIKVAESDLEQQRDREGWAQRMVKKGYYTISQAQSEQSKLESLEIALRKLQEEKRVLTDNTYGLAKRTITDYSNKVAEAERALARVKSQAHAKEVQFRADREAAKSVFLQEQDKYEDIKVEIKKCIIKSPQDGMVVYFVPEQARMGGGTQQSIVAQGEPVREGQKLMQIPDLRKMLVNVRVHEALVSRVHKGQPAVIKLDAFANRTLTGHVDSVATVAAQTDWMSADVKVYVTKVLIDGEVEGLKPGMSAEVTIAVSDALENVLTIPVQAVIGGPELGSKRKCFVITPNGPEQRDILVGVTNERVVEVKDGLVEGDQVVTNPKALVGDSMKTRQNEGKGGGDKQDGEKGGGKGPRGKGGPPPSGGPDGPPAGPAAMGGGPDGALPAPREGGKGRPKAAPGGE